MASRIYTVVFDNVSVTAVQDLFYIAPADDKPVEIIGLFIGQSSDVGDAAAEILRYSIIRGHTTPGSGGTAVSMTGRKADRSGNDAGFTARTNDTTIASAGTAITMHTDTFHVAAGEKVWFPEGCWHEATQGDTSIVVRLLSTPADALSMTGTLYVRESG